MTTNRKDLICRVLQGIGSGDPQSLAIINDARCVTHDPHAPAGGSGLSLLRQRLAEADSGVTILRVFEDGDFVFAHTLYQRPQRSVGFEIFRFEGDQVVEYWDNLQPEQGPNPSGHSMVDGQTQLLELELTESNREIVQSFIEDVLIQHQGEKIYDYVKWNHFVEHNPRGSDDLDALIALVSASGDTDVAEIRYDRCHRVLAEGNFVLSVCEGSLNGSPAAFYDLWCLEHDYIVEHWDTTQRIPPAGEWQNRHGKF
jgi:predicted SnoaL-like aldol condensation-catalyzing enzyme